MEKVMNPYTGLDALLSPENCTLLLIDHQPFQFAATHSIDSSVLINNVVGLAKTAKIYGVPTILTTVTKDRGGDLIHPIQEVFPEQTPIDRTFINTWQDEKVVKEVERLGRKKIVIAGLWTEVCVAMPTIQALGEGYEVYVVTDASGGFSPEAHERAVQRMVQAGARPITWVVFASELQRDWAREETAMALGPMLLENGGGIGVALAWEWQLMGAGKGA